MMLHSGFKTFLLVTVSASALGALLHFESVPARAVASTDVPPAPPAAAAPLSPPVLAPKEVPPPSSAAPAAPSRAIAAPDLLGKRLSVARRAVRKLGLVVVAHDDEGLRVDGEQDPRYRVRRQSTPAGAGVEPGATVEVRVREIDPPAGY